MNKRPTIENLDAMRAAICLLREQGYEVKGIANRVQLAENTVYKYLKQAKDRRWYEETVAVVPDIIGKDTLRSAEALIAQLTISNQITTFEQLRERIELKQARVFVFEADNTTDRDERLRQFGRRAAAQLARILGQDQLQTAGIAYGATINALLGGLRETWSQDKRGSVRCIPLCGDAGLDVDYSPSRMARLLASIISNNAAQCAYSATAIPPVMPSAARLQVKPSVALDFMRNYLNQFSEYDRLFGDDGLITKLDVIISSVGPPHSDSVITQRLYDLADFPQMELPLIGDMAGIPLLNNTKASNSIRKAVAAFEEDSLIGIRSALIRATLSKKNGRVVVAACDEPTRAECIRELLNRGLVTDLLIDTVVANRLAVLL